ncbi:MAG: penicillin-binding protein [Bacilli bacterium]
MKKRVTVKPSKIVLILISILLCLAIARLLQVAVFSKVDGINLKEFASSRNTVTKTLYAKRGTIYDSSGDALAVSVNSYTLIAYLEKSRTTDESNPQHVVDKEGTAKALAPILNMEESEILKYLNKDAYQVEFGSKGKNLTEITKKKIDDLELPGIDFIESTQRYYKMGSFASYLVGYAKTDDEGQIKGELGIESYYNEELSGTNGFITYQKDAYGYMLPNRPYYETEAKSGSDIYLTIDSNIQLIVENAMNDLKDNFNFDFGVFAIMDAETGALVASSTYPTFNPNDLNTLTNYLNPLISYTYEPGSTMKIFSWASAIEEGIYNGDELYDSGSIEVTDVTISDFNKIGWGKITFDEGFARSSNVAASILGLKIGKEKLLYYYDKFGFGKKTGITLSNESAGTCSFTYPSEIATSSFGQGGVTITPIQMLQALTSITNGGVMLKPYVIDKIVDSNGKNKFNSTKEEIGQVMKKETAEKMKELMYKANYDGLTKVWQPKTVSLSMKTGTAQIPNPKGGYLNGKYDQIYSMAGFFPSENPKYIVYVAVKQIEGTQGDVARMTTKAIDEIAAYADLTNNSAIKESNIITLDNYISSNMENTKEKLSNSGLNVITLGTGKYVINQYPLKNINVVKGEKIFLVSNKDDYIMPDVTNWSISDIKTFANLTNINLNIEGNGYVKTQSIEVGAPLTKDSELNVTLQ